MKRRLLKVLAMLSALLCAAIVLVWLFATAPSQFVGSESLTRCYGTGKYIMVLIVRPSSTGGRKRIDQNLWDGFGVSAYRQILPQPAGWIRFDQIRIHIAWPLSFCFGLLALALLLLALTRRRPGKCAVCGYDLRATPERCPECGTAVTTKPAEAAA
jgi:hypothetical protein